MRLPAVLLLASCFALATPWPVAAQTDEATKAEAQKLLAKGDTHLRRGDYHARKNRPERARAEYEQALASYEAAFDLFPSAKIYFPIALAEEKLGRHLDAIRHYRQLLEEAEDISDSVREAALDRLDEVKEHVVVLVLIVDPDGATVTVDGEVYGEAPLTDPLILPPGEHTVAITAEGYTPHEFTDTFAAGDQSQRMIELERIPVVVRKPRPRTPPPEESVPTVNRRPLLAGVTATAILAGAATITGLVAVARHGTFSDDSVALDERLDARDSGRRLAVMTDLLWLAAAGAGAYTVYYYYGTYAPEKRALEARRERDAAKRRSRAAMWLAPYAASDRLGVAVGGRF